MRANFARVLTLALALAGAASAVVLPKLMIGELETGTPSFAMPAPATRGSVIRLAPAPAPLRAVPARVPDRPVAPRLVRARVPVAAPVTQPARPKRTNPPAAPRRAAPTTSPTPAPVLVAVAVPSPAPVPVPQPTPAPSPAPSPSPAPAPMAVRMLAAAPVVEAEADTGKKAKRPKPEKGARHAARSAPQLPEPAAAGPPVDVHLAQEPAAVVEATDVAAPASDAPGNGHGRAKGHDKQK